MIKGQQWMRKRAGRWLLEGGGKRDECFPLHLIAQESKRAQNQIQLQSRRKSDKRQERLGTKMHDNSAQTQKLRNLITLEEFFPRNFFQNNSAEAVHIVSCYEIHDKKEVVDHGGPDETLSSLKELQSRVDEVEPLQSSTSPKKKCSPMLLKS